LKLQAFPRAVSLAASSLAVLLTITACGGASTNTGSAPAKIDTPPPAPAAKPTTTEQDFPRLRSEFDSTILPAAKNEGQFTWYTCVQAEEAEGRVKHFNQTYPEIKVNYVYLTPAEAVERITAEAASGRVTADLYQCAGQTGRILGWRGLTEPYTPPSAIDPSITYNWPVMGVEGSLTVFHIVFSGMIVNTKLVPQDKLPKTWWDAVRDPYWVDQLRQGTVPMNDPRSPGWGGNILYVLSQAQASDYGESWIRELAALKPRLVATAAGDADLERGEVNALLIGAMRWDAIKRGAPLTTWCPEPGCITSQYYHTPLKNAPHLNAARVWVEFWLTKGAQQHLADWGNTVARADVQVHPERDLKTRKLMLWPTDESERGILDTINWTQQSGLFSY
jgi:iron(III) transport system substrate-binding protein